MKKVLGNKHQRNWETLNKNTKYDAQLHVLWLMIFYAIMDSTIEYLYVSVSSLRTYEPQKLACEQTRERSVFFYEDMHEALGTRLSVDTPVLVVSLEEDPTTALMVSYVYYILHLSPTSVTYMKHVNMSICGQHFRFPKSRPHYKLLLGFVTLSKSNFSCRISLGPAIACQKSTHCKEPQRNPTELQQDQEQQAVKKTANKCHVGVPDGRITKGTEES